MKKNDKNIIPALNQFCRKLTSYGNPAHLIPLPGRGSACKRINLFMRWMVRRDAVDPGGWEGISPPMLTIPLDVHMHRTGRILQLTSRKQANMRTALEITDGFSKWVPEDPVRYDFSLTRLGIRKDMTDIQIHFEI